MRAYHDLGGLPAGPLDLSEHAHAPWEKRTHALLWLLTRRGVMTVDELRRGIEAIPEDDYHRLSYYRRWMRSITDNLLRKGVITEAELRAALERV